MDSRATAIGRLIHDVLTKPIYTTDPAIASVLHDTLPHTKRLGGMPAGVIGQSLCALKDMHSEMGIEVGIPLPRGRFIGDIVELAGFDCKGRTAKVATGFAKILAS
jgi:hypothetical protein